jgi:hypothetical protein
MPVQEWNEANTRVFDIAERERSPKVRTSFLTRSSSGFLLSLWDIPGGSRRDLKEFLLFSSKQVLHFVCLFRFHFISRRVLFLPLAGHRAFPLNYLIRILLIAKHFQR